MKKPGELPEENEPAPRLPMPNRLARLFRALTSYTQPEFGHRAGIHPSSIGHFELGDEVPSAGHLEAMARVAHTTVAAGIEMLRWHDTLSHPRLRAGGDVEALYARVGADIYARLDRTYQSFLRLPLTPPAIEEQDVEAQMELLRLLDETERLPVVLSNQEFQTRALADRAAQESAASPQAAGSAAWARLAEEIARLAKPRKRQPRTKGR